MFFEAIKRLKFLEYWKKFNDFVYFYFQAIKLRNLAFLAEEFHPRLLPTSNENSSTLGLEYLFTMHGSDKSTHHDYHYLYESLFHDRRFGLRTIVEIGIGSNNPLTPQNMGENGVPGASLRAFRDWAPNAQVYGADIDSEILFQENRISTFHVDQLYPQSFTPLLDQLGHGVDLVVVDGLHTPRAEINSIIALLPYLNSGGALVVEDISQRAAKYLWSYFHHFLPSDYYSELKEMLNGWIVRISRFDNIENYFSASLESPK